MKPPQRQAALMPDTCMDSGIEFPHTTMKIADFDWIHYCIVNYILKTFSNNISVFIYSNLIQLTSSALLKKIKVSAGQLGLGNDTFSSICGHFFSRKTRCTF